MELGLLCSNDPVCAQHGCLLISETSCEQQNDYLDRALVVRTVQNLGAELFLEVAGETAASGAGTV